MDNEKIYFDNAATTNLGAEVLSAMLPVLTDTYGNSSSMHSFALYVMQGFISLMLFGNLLGGMNFNKVKLSFI